MQNLFQKFQIFSDKNFFRTARFDPADAAAFPCENIKKAAQPFAWLGGTSKIIIQKIFFSFYVFCSNIVALSGDNHRLAVYDIRTVL